MNSKCVFTNDAHVSLYLTNHRFSSTFSKRNNHEVLFRQISTYLIKSEAIKGSIIDLGAWIGDNSIPWAKQIGSDRTVYAIDPSPENCAYIADMCALNDISNVRIIQKAISDKTEVLSTNESLYHCSFVYGNPGVSGATKVDACSLDQLGLINIGYIHLDVEGMEARVLAGAEKLLDTCRPIVAFEQHLQIDDYLSLSSKIIAKGYNVFMIDEVLPACRSDCRNFLAFPKEYIVQGFLEGIYEAVKAKCLVSITPSS